MTQLIFLGSEPPHSAVLSAAITICC